MKHFDLPVPLFGFIVGTRVLLGAGIGLLVAEKLDRRTRRKVGAAFVGLGALTTIPAAFFLFGRPSNPERDVRVVAT